MVTNIHTVFASQRNYDALKTGAAAFRSKLLYSVGILTDEMCPAGGNACTTPVSSYGTIVISPGVISSYWFLIEYTDLPADVCIRLATHDWGDNSMSVELLAVLVL